MTAFDDARLEEAEGEDALRNPGGEAADDEADFHGDRLAEPEHLEYGDDEVPAEDD